VLGALGAIPLAGTLQVLVLDWLAHRKGHGDPAAKEAAPG
jgi:hypothetical protein